MQTPLHRALPDIVGQSVAQLTFIKPGLYVLQGH